MLDCYGTIVEIFTERTPMEHRVWTVLSMFMGYYSYRYDPQELYRYFNEELEKERPIGKKRANGELFDTDEWNVYNVCFINYWTVKSSHS